MTYQYGPIVDDLLAWYDDHKRSLPWRDDPRPYYVWVSEIMLQQTRVEAVKGYFDRFMTELPTIKELANANEDKLMKLWEGLGYYNRVRNLQKAAIVLMEEYNGELPADFEELKKLPGIGSYTAGAVASIAFQVKVPAVDGNVLRITKRIAASYDDITKAKVIKEVEMDLREIMPDRPGDFNQALMDLGATICIPNGRPLCGECPIATHCNALKQNIMMELPVKPSKKPRKLEDKTVFVMEYQNKYAIEKRSKKGLLAGMWQLPNMEGYLSVEEVEELLQQAGFTDFEIELLGKAKHIFSHVEWHMLGYQIKINEEIDKAQPKVSIDTKDSIAVGEYNWVSKTQLSDKYALPTAFQAYKTWK